MLGTDIERITYCYGRFLAVAAYVIGEISMDLSFTQPTVFFPKYVQQINKSLSHTEQSERENIEALLAEIIAKFPAKGLPAHFTNEEQTDICLGYYHQKVRLPMR